MPTADLLGNGVLALVLNAGPVAKVVLAVLLVFSIASWGLIVEKAWQFRRVRRQTLAFLRVFREGRRASVIHGAARTMRESPLAQLYSAAYHEVSRLPEGIEPVYDEVDEGLGADRLEAAHRALRRAAAHEVAQLERYLGFLATTASATPFIGLFGTVWGVMAAFQVIGYNYFVNRVKHWATEMEGFTLDLLNTLSRPAPKIGRPAKDGI